MNQPSSQLLGSFHLGRELKEYGIWSEESALLGCVTSAYYLYLSVPLVSSTMEWA